MTPSATGVAGVCHGHFKGEYGAVQYDFSRERSHPPAGVAASRKRCDAIVVQLGGDTSTRRVYLVERKGVLDEEQYSKAIAQLSATECRMKVGQGWEIEKLILFSGPLKANVPILRRIHGGADVALINTSEQTTAHRPDRNRAVPEMIQFFDC